MKRTIVIALIVVSMVFGVVAFATAAGTTDTGTVNVSVTPNALIKLTLSTTTVAFPAIDPGVASAVIPVTVGVSSNKGFNLTKTTTGAPAMGLTTSLADITLKAGPKGVNTYTDNYQVTVPWTTDGGTPLAATVKYDVTQ
jgi:hypothetical protein